MKKYMLALPMVVVAATFALAYAEDSKADPRVYARDSVVFSRTYGDWAAAWWQWAFSLTASNHPLFDTADCSVGQSGPVWFLGGKFCSTGQGNTCSPGSAIRSCTVPAGKAIFFPVVNISCVSEEATQGLCGSAKAIISEMRDFTTSAIDGVPPEDFSATLDGHSIRGVKSDFRVQAPVFDAVIPQFGQGQLNLLQAIGENIEAGTYFTAEDGVYVMLTPPRSGEHVLKFSVNGILDITYTLTVQ